MISAVVPNTKVADMLEMVHEHGEGPSVTYSALLPCSLPHDSLTFGVNNLFVSIGCVFISNEND